MPSRGMAAGRHGRLRGGFHAHPTLRVVRACHPIAEVILRPILIFPRLSHSERGAVHPMMSRRTILAVGAAAFGELASGMQGFADEPKRRVVVWSEGSAPKKVYPKDINTAVAEGLKPLEGWDV